MWAACCNWFCLDSQPEEITPHAGNRTQAYSNPGYSTHPNSMPSNCRGCGGRFENAARKTNESVPVRTESNPDRASQAEEVVEDEVQSTDSEEILVPGRRCSLSDLSSVEDIEALTVRQLKEILARNFVNYKGCCEKWELMERVTRLYNEQQDIRQQAEVVLPGSEDPLCKICMDSPIDCVLLECGHMVTCTKCGMRMSECPICRQYVVRAVHVFRS